MKVTSSNNPFVILYQAMWHYSQGFRGRLPVFMGLLIVGMFVWQLSPFVMGKMINELQYMVTGKGSSSWSIYQWILLYGGINLISWLFHTPGRILERQFAFKLRTACFNDLYHRLQALPLAWHQDHHSGKILSRIQTATESLYNFSERQFSTIETVMKIIVPVGFLTYLAWPLALLCFASGVVIFFVITKFDKILIPIFKKRRDIIHDLSALLFDYIANMQTIITLRLGIHTKKEVSHRLDQQKQIFYDEAKWNEYKWWTVDSLVTINKILAILYTIWLFQQGKIVEIGLIVSLVQYLENFSSVFFDIGGRYETIIRQANDYKSTTSIHETYDLLPHHASDTGLEANHSFETLDAANMVFAYKDSQTGGLNDVSLSIRKGEKIAFVGTSGSGKSTTMKLLRVLYPLQGGTLTINGMLQDDFEPLKDMTTLIPQEPEIFENTIRYNITMGVEHDDAAILEACRIACFDTVLKQLPKGLDTDIREKGVNLSGGQKQRLALARGVFAIEDSEIILLDEPTSSVDGMTEQRIYNNLMHAFPDKVLISSIHRLHMLTQFNKIYVFDQGQIVQSGTLTELLQQDGPFKAMYQAYQISQDIS